MYAAHILNRLPSTAISNEIPAKRAEIEIDYTKLKIFGCEAYTHIENQFRARFDSKAKRMKLIGITNTGYKVYNPENRTIYTRSDIKFIEADKADQRSMIKVDPEEQEDVADDNTKTTQRRKREERRNT